MEVENINLKKNNNSDLSINQNIVDKLNQDFFFNSNILNYLEEISLILNSSSENTNLNINLSSYKYINFILNINNKINKLSDKSKYFYFNKLLWKTKFQIMKLMKMMLIKKK